jgi:hypothetical protein
MTETARTITYVVVACALMGLAWAAGPRTVATIAEEETGSFFPDWKDALAPTSLEIVEYDEETGTIHPFKVVQVDGKWSIPSHYEYPTDAERQLGEAAASIFELQKLSVVTKDKSEHALYGVIDPDPASLKGGEQGVGKRVVLEDKQGKKLAQLIIGKEDKAGIRFVRVPGQDAVYRAELRPEKLSTKFGDWIEKDLLKINTWDLKEVVINNYTFDVLNMKVTPHDRLNLSYDGNASKWTLADLSEGEELNTDNLNKLKNALDDLKIVDVRRKPEGLGRELRAEEGGGIDQQAVRDLAQRGFFITPQGGLISNEGEVIVKMNDGVLYVLRFGAIAPDTGGPTEKKEAAEEGASSGANRYIFIMAQLDESIIPKPDLKPLPGEQQLPALPEEKKTSQNAPSGDETLLALADQAPPATETKPAEEPKQDAKTDEQPKEEAQEGEEPKSKRDQERERQEIEKENKRKQDEYNDKLKKAQDRVKELNNRFADWYYVISDAEYKKIHLTRTDVVKQKEGASEDKTGVEQFKKLKEEGLKDD